MLQGDNRGICLKARNSEDHPVQKFVPSQDVFPKNEPSDSIVSISVHSDRRAIGIHAFSLLYLSYTRGTLSGTVAVAPEANGCYMGLILKVSKLMEGVKGSCYEQLMVCLSPTGESEDDIKSLLAKLRPASKPN